MIVGKHVRLRAIEKEDLPRFTEWLNDAEVRRNLVLHQPLSLAQEEKWYEDILKKPVSEQPLSIDILSDGGWQHAGNCGLFDFDEHARSAEIGIFIGQKSLWGKGYGCEAMRLMTRHGFLQLNLNRIFLRVFETNPNAIHCYEKAGFKHEGRLREAHFLDGRYIDVLIMSILKSEIEQEEKNGGK